MRSHVVGKVCGVLAPIVAVRAEIGFLVGMVRVQMHGEVYGHVTAEAAKWADEEHSVMIVHHVHSLCWQYPGHRPFWVSFTSKDAVLRICNKSEKQIYAL